VSINLSAVAIPAISTNRYVRRTNIRSISSEATIQHQRAYLFHNVCLCELRLASRPAASTGISTGESQWRRTKGGIFPSWIQGWSKSVVGEYVSSRGRTQCYILRPIPTEATYPHTDRIRPCLSASINYVCQYGPGPGGNARSNELAQ
jgi:hypothetical protein